MSQTWPQYLTRHPAACYERTKGQDYRLYLGSNSPGKFGLGSGGIMRQVLILPRIMVLQAIPDSQPIFDRVA